MERLPFALCPLSWQRPLPTCVPTLLHKQLGRWRQGSPSVSTRQFKASLQILLSEDRKWADTWPLPQGRLDRAAQTLPCQHLSPPGVTLGKCTASLSLSDLEGPCGVTWGRAEHTTGLMAMSAGLTGIRAWPSASERGWLCKYPAINSGPAACMALDESLFRASVAPSVKWDHQPCLPPGAATRTP